MYMTSRSKRHFLLKLPYAYCCVDVECVFSQPDRTHLVIYLMTV